MHPNVVLQLSLVQGLLSLQTTAVPTHAPLPLQVVPAVQGLLSSQLVALVMVNLQPVAVRQLSVVQVLLSVQVMAVWTQPDWAQLSAVQALPSLQSVPEPLHRLPSHAEVAVQLLPSSQVAPGVAV
jgi:hypothetical protein